MATTRAILTPYSAEFPTSNAAALTRVNERPALAFDAATDESARWTLAVPQGFTGTMTAVISYIAASATTGAVRFQVQVEAFTAADAVDLDATTSFDTANSNGGTVPGTAGHLGQISVTLTNQDSAAAADYLRIHLNRDADGTSGTDDATGDCYVLVVELRDAA
jgi:hypothetical protein